MFGVQVMMGGRGSPDLPDGAGAVVSTTLRTVARALHHSVRVSNLTATVFSGVNISLDVCREVSMDLRRAELARVRLAMAVDPL